MGRFLILIWLFLTPIFSFSQSRYVLPASERLQTSSLGLLKAFVGFTEETNKNDGEPFYTVQDYIGIRRGSAYCQALQYYCFDITAKFYDEVNPIPRNALAQATYNTARKHQKRTPYKAKIGDLIVWKKGRTAFGHIERIESVQKGGWVITIAGNVQQGKKQGIFRKRRNIAQPISRLLKVKGLVGFYENNLKE